VLEPLTRTIRASHPKADLRPIVRAYEVAEQCHEGQRRRSGDPYITHPLAVTTILAELGMDTTTLVAALLHDTVEDTRYTLDDVRSEFGVDVAHLVDGVTKLDKVQFGDAPRPRRSARWSWRWPATRGCWSSSWPTGCTTCAPCAGCSRRSRSGSPARRWRSSRRSPTGSA
jgi:hypothetical protein